MDSKILYELFTFDKTYLGSKENNGFNYLENYFEIKSSESNEIVSDLFKSTQYNFNNEKNNSKNFNNLIEVIEKNFTLLGIDFRTNVFIKNEKSLGFAFICFFILKFFTTHDPLKIKKEKGDELEINIGSVFKNDADSLINFIILCLEKMFIWIEINCKNSFTVNKKKTRLGLMWFLKEICEKENCLILEATKYPQKGMFFRIKKEYNLNFNIELSNSPYKLYNDKNEQLYLYSYHFTTVNTIFKPNPRSNKSISKSRSILVSLNNILNNYIYISNLSLQKIIEDLCEEFLIDEKTILVNYRALLKNFSTCIMKDDESLAREISIEISNYLRIINLINIRKNNDETRKIFLPPMICFRGRTYFLSSASLTFQKELRYCSHWGNYTDPEKKFDHFLLERVETGLTKNHSKLECLRKYNFNNMTNSIKNAVIWILISIAETKKEKNSSWNIKEFIEKGIELVENWEIERLKEDVENRIKIQYHINILEELNKGIFKKWLISKDATASVFQHCAKTVGIQNKETLKWCNFESEDTWYDTYSFIINGWKNQVEERWKKTELLEKFFTRSSLKNTIMTHNYGANINASFKRFDKLIKNKFKEEVFKASDEVLIKKIFYNFFDFLENKPSLLQYSSKMMKNELKKINRNEITFCDGTTVFLQYNRVTIIQLEEQVKKKRITKQQITLLNDLDQKKIDNSIRANYVQGLDASLVRWFYSMNYKGITVHDCFLVDYMSVSFLIATINQGMRIQFHALKDELNFDVGNIFSVFILL